MVCLSVSCPGWVRRPARGLSNRGESTFLTGFMGPTSWFALRGAGILLIEQDDVLRILSHLSLMPADDFLRSYPRLAQYPTVYFEYCVMPLLPWVDNQSPGVIADMYGPLGRTRESSARD